MSNEIKNRALASIVLSLQGDQDPLFAGGHGVRNEVGVSPVRAGLGFYEVTLLPDAYGQVDLNALPLSDIHGQYCLATHAMGSAARMASAFLATDSIPLPGQDTIRIVTFDPTTGLAADSDGIVAVEVRAIPFEITG